MKCSKCTSDSPQGKRFCGECGAPLSGLCPKCGAENPPAKKFCSDCGASLTANTATKPEPRSYTPKHLAEKILTSRSALEGERKQVTVLFADIKSSMELSADLDPEQWHRIMDRFFAILSEGIHRFEGTVNQYTGDGVMALFGAPIAHEDHARRACYAALHLSQQLRRYADELRRTQGMSFSVRMGLNSGEVVVGKIGDDLRMDYTAQGHTVGLAARVEQLAEPGRVYLTEHTRALAEGFFKLRDLGRFELKGVRDPVSVYELEGVGAMRTRLDVSRARGFSRFVGRDQEMTNLEAALSRAEAGSGQVIGVVADAGLGKSRLCYEFAQRCRAKGLSVYEAHCQSHGKMLPYLPVLEFLRGYFGIIEQDNDEQARRKIAGALILLDKEFDEVMPLWFDFLGVPDPERPSPRMDPEARERQLLSNVKRAMAARSRKELALILFEDLHWIDGASESFLAGLVDGTQNTRTLLLTNFRPEYHAAWMQRSYYQQMPLMPLGDAAISELLVDLMGKHSSLNGLPLQIRQRTAGNPFFIEEVVNALSETGSLKGARGDYRLETPLAALTIPATVHPVLEARIDRLDEREKRVLQTAAVIGKDFTESVLRQVAELSTTELSEALQKLIGAEFIYEQALYPEAEYTFKHPLTQQVAYESQLSERRSRVHAVVANAIAEIHHEKLDERAAEIAQHWESAEQNVEAARWHERAARWAGASNPEEALRHWQKVRRLTRSDTESSESTRRYVDACSQILNFAWRVGMPRREAEEIFAEGGAAATRLADPRATALLLWAYATAGDVGGFDPGFLAKQLEAERLAQESGDHELELAIRPLGTWARFVAGDLKGALLSAKWVREAAAADPRLGERILGYSPGDYVAFASGLYLTYLGRVRDAARELEQAEALARQHGEAELLRWACTSLGILGVFLGDEPLALSSAQRSVESAQRTGSDFDKAVALHFLGRAQLLARLNTEALSSCETALVLMRDRRVALYMEPVFVAILAEARLACGDTRAALAAAREALETTRNPRWRMGDIDCRLALARVLVAVEGVAARSAVEAALDEARSIVESTGARVYEPFILVERANLARLLGDDAGYQRELREAHRLFVAMGATGHALAKELRL